MNASFKRSFGFSVLTLLLLPVAHAQRPVAGNSAAEKPWPNVGFQQVLDTPPFFAGLKQQIPPDRTSNDGNIFTGIANAGDGSNRLYLVEQRGRVWMVENGKLSTEPLLDISSLTSCEAKSEHGLMSLAFPPDFKTRQEFYVFYTSNGTAPNADGDLILERFKVDPKDPNKVVANSGQIVMSVGHPRAPYHVGGQIAFGKDGLLYWAPADYVNESVAQDLGSDMGKMLRIDVEGKPDEGKNYHVPTDNPFLKTAGANPEIWALGLRNPFHFSFDSATGDLYIANVGQDKYEGIYFQSASSKGGENYGWSIYEGTHAFQFPRQAPATQGTTGGITYPVVELTHPMPGPDDFKCLIGGYVYHGSEFPGWVGDYFFSDWVSGKIFAMRRNSDGKWEWHDVDGIKNPALGVVAFGTDEKGNLYISSNGDGKIYKLVELPPATK